LTYRVAVPQKPRGCIDAKALVIEYFQSGVPSGTQHCLIQLPVREFDFEVLHDWEYKNPGTDFQEGKYFEVFIQFYRRNGDAHSRIKLVAGKILQEAGIR
jgi:hypothetical protein